MTGLLRAISMTGVLLRAMSMTVLNHSYERLFTES